MSRRWRVILALCGVLMLCCAAAVLVYVLWPLESLREQLPVAPTLFAPPQSSVPWLRWL